MLAWTGQVTAAVAVGGIEVVAKLVLYFLHERAWGRIRWGKREVPAFVMWFTGLPASGKTTAAATVCDELRKRGLKVEHLDSHDVRALFPETGFTREEVDGHIRHAGHVASMLEKQGVVVAASFVSPYSESRGFVRGLCSHFIEVYLHSAPESCEARDTKGVYARARAGEIRDLPGVNGTYEEPTDPEIRIEVDELSEQQVAKQVLAQLDLARRKGAPSKERGLAAVRRRQSAA